MHECINHVCIGMLVILVSTLISLTWHWLPNCLTARQNDNFVPTELLISKVSSYRRDQGRGYNKGNGTCRCLWFFVSFANAGHLRHKISHFLASFVMLVDVLSLPKECTVVSKWALLHFLIFCMITINNEILVQLRLWCGLSVIAYPQSYGGISWIFWSSNVDFYWLILISWLRISIYVFRLQVYN